MSDNIRSEVTDRIATITIDRPEAKNAMDLGTLTALLEAARAADEDPSVDVVILTATGSVFCAGLDLTALSSGEIDIAENTALGNPWVGRQKPMIAAVNGPAITGGLELVLNSDFAIATPGAKFADTHTRVGILPFWGMSALLPLAVGQRNAALMSFTGNFISAQQALDWGLVSEIVPDAELAERARQLASDIASNDQPGVRAMKNLYDTSAGYSIADALELEVERAIDWHGEGFSAADIAERFEAIKERGRAQSARTSR